MEKINKFIGSKTVTKINPLFTFLLTMGFVFLDCVWQNSLPRWNISYGPIIISLVLFAIPRISLFLLWLIILVLFRKVLVNFSRISFWIILIPNLILTVFGLYMFCVEPFFITQTRIEIPVPGLTHTVRLVQLSDIHVERTTRREEKLPVVIEKLNPDMIVMTGDFINKSYKYDSIAIRDLRSLVSQFDAPLGVYAVSGNVEDPEQLEIFFSGTNVEWLDNEIVRFPEISDHFVLLGLTYQLWKYDEKTLAQLVDQVNAEDFTLLLYHTPDIISTASNLNVDLYLAGHTHGGQFRLPFYGALYTNSRHGKRFEMGLYQVNQTTLFVTRGIGFSGGFAPRIRFLAPPEVVVIDLVPEKATQE